MNDIERAWIAGIIDCDGSITTNGLNKSLRITVCSTDLKFLEAIQRVTYEFKGRIYRGNNPVNYKDRYPRKQSYHLTFLRKKETQALLTVIEPFLVAKKTLAESRLN